MHKDKKQILEASKRLRQAYLTGELGEIYFPEEQHPQFSTAEERLIYFTLPMSLNYRRQSIKLWKSALNTWNDPATRDVFNIEEVAKLSHEQLQTKLTKHKVALFKEINTRTWKTVASTIHENWSGVSQMLTHVSQDYLELRQLVQNDNKPGFPYLSGPKIFNYWSFILGLYGGVELKNRSYIEIAPDTHVIKASIRLGVITPEEGSRLSRDQISAVWRELLEGSGIDPIDMHPPLWFWSKGGFKFEVG